MLIVPKNAPQILKSIGDISPGCPRLRLINRNEITEKAATIARRTKNMKRVLTLYKLQIIHTVFSRISPSNEVGKPNK